MHNLLPQSRSFGRKINHHAQILSCHWFRCPQVGRVHSPTMNVWNGKFPWPKSSLPSNLVWNFRGHENKAFHFPRLIWIGWWWVLRASLCLSPTLIPSTYELWTILFVWTCCGPLLLCGCLFATMFSMSLDWWSDIFSGLVNFCWYF